MWPPPFVSFEEKSYADCAEPIPAPEHIGDEVNAEGAAAELSKFDLDDDDDDDDWDEARSSANIASALIELLDEKVFQITRGCGLDLKGLVFLYHVQC
jgi:hypothetical protein